MARTTTTKKKRGRGRPPKLTREVLDKIVRLMREGNFFATACRAAGIHRSTAYLWRTQGEADFLEDRRTLYAEFFDRVGHAEAVAETLYVHSQPRAARSGKREHVAAAGAALSFLKVRWSRRWGKGEAAGRGGRGAPEEPTTPPEASALGNLDDLTDAELDQLEALHTRVRERRAAKLRGA
jgi:hypothetical protein